MRYYLPLIILLLGCSEKEILNQRKINFEGEEILIDKVNLEGLNEEPFAEWYNFYYQDRAPDKAQLDMISSKIDEAEIAVFLGTWCTDSHEQVPGFVRMLTYMGYDISKITLIALEKTENGDLVSQKGYEKGMNITHVPTFIFSKGSKELGRIVEYPEESLEADMVSIILDGE